MAHSRVLILYIRIIELPGLLLITWNRSQPTYITLPSPNEREIVLENATIETQISSFFLLSLSVAREIVRVRYSSSMPFLVTSIFFFLLVPPEDEEEN